MKIASYVDDGGKVANFYEPGCVCLYERAAGTWVRRKELALALRVGMHLAEVRMRLKAMAAHLEECKVFLAGEVKGIPYTILEGMGFNIWKAEGSVIERLDFVAQKEREAAEAAGRPKPTPLPVGDIRDGLYHINLTEVLGSDPGLTSRQVLIPFLATTAFQKLEILCDHPPRWLPGELARLNMRAETGTPGHPGGGVTIIVLPLP
jgi:Fe-only nitrogenase accessory protein AnfO